VSAIIKNMCVFLYMMCIIDLYFVYILSGKRDLGLLELNDLDCVHMMILL